MTMTTSIARPPQPLGFKFQQQELTDIKYSDESLELASSLDFSGRQRSSHPQLEHHYRNNRTSRPAQYGHPLSLSSAHATGSTLFTGRQVEEHMLRRKTPNGTLAAGYDGNQVEWMKRPHAFKHLVMQGEGRQQLKNSPRLNRDFGSPEATSTNQPLQPEITTRDGRSLWNQHTAMTLEASFQKPVAKLDMEPTSLDHLSRAVPRMDSILNQSQVLQQPFLGGAFQTVPIVLQPGWQPSAGPTASDKQGQYGPYWPDGAYIPYRPAAFRDVRIDPNNVSTWRNAQEDTRERAFPGVRCNDQDPQYYGNLDSRAALKSSYPQASASIIQQNRAVAQNCSPIDLQGLSLGMVQGGNESWLTKRSPFRTILPQEQGAPSNERSPSWQDLPISATSLTTDRSSYGVASSHLRFKERMLIEAHRAYLNLLASQPHAQQHTSIRNSTNERLSSYMTPQSPFSSNFRSVHPVRPSPVLFTARYPVDRGRRSAASTFQHADMKPATSATKALEVLTQLCQESEWQWVDGILLGGCLAYALTDYEKALQWYYRVLACDPK